MQCCQGNHQSCRTRLNNSREDDAEQQILPCSKSRQSSDIHRFIERRYAVFHEREAHQQKTQRREQSPNFGNTTFKADQRKRTQSDERQCCSFEIKLEPQHRYQPAGERGSEVCTEDNAERIFQRNDTRADKCQHQKTDE